MFLQIKLILIKIIQEKLNAFLHKEEAWVRGDFFQLKSQGLLVLPAYFLGWVVVCQSMARNGSYNDKKCKTNHFNNLSRYFSSKNYQNFRQ